MKAIKIEIKKLVTMAELGLGVERPLNKEKRYWIKKLAKNKKQKHYDINAIIIPIKSGLQLAKANKILRDADKDSKYKLKVSGLINEWAQDQIDN